MAKKRHYGSDRAMAMKSSGMLNNDTSAVANMPQSVKYTGWGNGTFGALDPVLNDTIEGINAQMSKDESKAKSIMKPHKY